MRPRPGLSVSRSAVSGCVAHGARAGPRAKQAAGLTLDSGALIVFERSDRRVIAHLKEAAQRGAELTVPTVVTAEVWRGGSRSARVARLLRACSIEALSEALAREAGETNLERAGGVPSIRSR